MKHPPSDQNIRDEALSTTQSFILEAPAGSGKTDLLTARFLALLSRVSHPSQILAVTFTRKAAAEMANRITEKLKLAGQKDAAAAENPWDARFLSLGKEVLLKHRDHLSVLFNPDSFRVGTFHSFCASVVRSWPLEARILPGVDILEDIDQEAMLDLVVEQYVRDVVAGKTTLEEQEAYERRLVSSNNYPAAITDQLKQLMRRRDRLKDFPVLFSTQTDPERLKSELEERLRNYVATSLSALRSSFIRMEDDWEALRQSLAKDGAAKGENFPENIPGDGFEDIPGWKRVASAFLTGKGTARKRFETRYGFPKDFSKSRSADLIKNLPLPESTQLAFVSSWPDAAEDNVGSSDLIAILILARGVLMRLQERVRSLGMDYLELELAALRALEWADRPSESLVFHHEHLRHILVDEAQDLNDGQAQILGKLTEGWEPGDGRTVFMVGDPKQSIYRFRRAEVSLFYDLTEKGLIREGEEPLPLKPLTLTANFRSRPHLVDFANELFEKVMSSPKREHDEVSFSLSKSARDDAAHLIRTEIAIFYDEKGSNNQILTPLEREARWVADSVARRHAENPEETIAILVPVRTHLPTYVELLRKIDVPLRLVEGMPLQERPEVIHLWNLFTALVRPYDDVAWAGALRATWFHVPNQLLFDMGSAQGLWSQRILSKKEIFPELALFCAAVTEANKKFGREPYATTLSRLWEDMGGPRSVASHDGEWGISNVRAFFGLVNLCSGLPGEEALAKLQRLMEGAYTPPDPKGAFSNVYMMTIHKAKGLEFDHVFAVNLNYDPLGGWKNEQPAYRMERLPGEKHFLVAATADKRTGKERLAAHLLRDLEKNRILAEARRLFYVVATRARESLTLSGTIKPPDEKKEEHSFRKPLSSLLGIMSNRSPLISLLKNPEPSILPEVEKKGVDLPLTPPPFEAEPLPYEILSPSKVEDETLQAVEPGAEDEGEDHARAKGLVVHRILETFARNNPSPDLEAVTGALCEEGIPVNEARELACDALEEARTAWACPGFRSMRESAQEVHAEWPLEDFDGEHTLRVGRFDLLLKTADGWVIVDYKTGQPEKDVDAWLIRQAKHYRPQLTAYRQMVAKVLNVPDGKVRWAMYFTAIPRMVWQESSS